MEINKSLSTSSLFKSIAIIATPLALQGVLISMEQLVDNLFLVNLKNADQIEAGINPINSIVLIITTIVVGFMSGIGIYFAQAAGKNDVNLQKKLFICKFIYTFLIASFLIIVASIFLSRISRMWLPRGPNSNISFQASKDYGTIIIPSLMIEYLVLVMSSCFKEKKKIWFANFISLATILMNCALNYPLMYILDLGIKGSAIATASARGVELIIWITYLLITSPSFLPKIKEWFSLKWQTQFKLVFKRSIFWTLNSFIFTFAFFLQIMFMSRTSIANGATLNSTSVLSQIIQAFITGYASAVGIVAMHHLASLKNISNSYLKIYTKKLSSLAVIFGVFIGIFISAFSWIVFYIYPNSSSYKKMQTVIILIAIASTSWISLWVSVYISIFKGVGYAKIITLDGIYSWAINLSITLVLVNFAKDIMDLGYIYWIIAGITIFKPLFFKVFLLTRKNDFKIIAKTTKNHLLQKVESNK